MPNSKIVPIQLMKGSKVVPMTPDEYARYQQAILVNNAQTWLLTLIAAFLFLSTFSVRNPAIKSGAIFTALAVAIAARLSSGENVRDDRISKDITDGSDSARQSRIFQQTAIDQVPVDAWFEAVEESEESNEPAHDLLCKPHSRDFVERFTLDRNSKLIVAAPGSGKTVTAKAWIATLLHFFPDALVLINYRKVASFCGLETVPNCTAQSRQGNLGGLFSQMALFHALHQARSDMPPDVRANQPPAVFYIADYAATWGNISAILADKASPHKQAARLFLERMAEIITVGRENNCQLVIDTQSFNLTALGGIDSNERGCLTTLGLGFESVDKFGQKSGNYEVLQLLIRNAFMISSDADREQLINWLPLMRDYSQQTRQPLAFTTLGGAELFFLPDYRFFENHTLPNDTLTRLSDTLQTAIREHGYDINLESIFPISDKFQGELKSAEIAETFQPISGSAETLKPNESSIFQDSFQVSARYTNRNLPPDEARTLIRLLISEGMNQTQIIKLLWDANPGGSKAYLQARSEYDFLIAPEAEDD